MPAHLTRRKLMVRLAGWLFGLTAGIFPFTGKSYAEKVLHIYSTEVPMKLPQPQISAGATLGRAIKNRRSIRSFSPESLKLEQLSQLLWSAQGITADSGFKRAAPSAGALYPMDLYAVVGAERVEGFKEGIYHYVPGRHTLAVVVAGDFNRELARAALSQTWMAQAPLTLVITAEYRRITVKYRDRGIRYAMIEAGHIGQNIFLMAEALGLGAGIVGAFNDEEVNRLMQIPRTHEPLLIMPVGMKH